MKVNKCVIFAFLITSFSIGGVFFIFNGDYFVEESNQLKLTSSVLDKEYLLSEKSNSQEPEIDDLSEGSSFPVPEIVRAIYMTSWSASKETYIDYVINLAKETDINAVVIDVKDFSGYVAYDTKVEKVEEYGVRQVRIKDINSLIKRFHDDNLYVIARITVFQDPILAKARNDLAILSKELITIPVTSNNLWKDNLGLAWIDPAGKESWDYNISIAKDALDQGFDEINFDYVRFPSDGNLKDMVFPFWKGEVKKHEVMEEFFAYLRKEMPEAILSVNLFGLSTVSHNDLGIGQIIEDAYDYFDYICPMVYPSHYSSGFLGYDNPAEYPYEVVEKSISVALDRLKKHNRADEIILRPWLQDFNLGTEYDAEMVKAEIRAVEDAAGDDYAGYMLWSPYNFYTKEALKSNIELDE
jgi:hypothetical protein